MKAFDRVIGYDEVKRDLVRIADMVVNTEKYEALGARLPKGVLIHGAPGLGKTLLAEAFIESAGVYSVTIRHDRNRDELIDHIKSCFTEASKQEKAIVLLDDMDKFSMEERNGEEFAVIQACIDEVKNARVLVLATANDIDDIPDSLLRHGRFDMIVSISNPRGKDSERIITHYLEGVRLDAGVDREDVAKMLVGKSCATLEAVINSAAISAAYADRDSIGIDDLVEATLAGVYGVENNCCRMSPKEREEVAYHEAGHTLIGELICPGSVGIVSLSGNGNSRKEGFTFFCNPARRRPHSVLIALGGKAACEMRYGRVASGTYSDIDSAYSMIMEGITEMATEVWDWCRPSVIPIRTERDARAWWVRSLSALAIRLRKWWRKTVSFLKSWPQSLCREAFSGIPTSDAFVRAVR